MMGGSLSAPASIATQLLCGMISAMVQVCFVSLRRRQGWAGGPVAPSLRSRLLGPILQTGTIRTQAVEGPGWGTLALAQNIC